MKDVLGQLIYDDKPSILKSFLPDISPKIMKEVFNFRGREQTIFRGPLVDPVYYMPFSLTFNFMFGKFKFY